MDRTTKPPLNQRLPADQFFHGGDSPFDAQAGDRSICGSLLYGR
jgi:hypothetical protein